MTTAQTPTEPAPIPSLEYVGVLARLGSTVIDTILYFIFAGIVAAMTGNTTEEGFQLEGGLAFLTLALWTAYFVGMEGFLRGTVGKLILQQQVVNERGEAPGLVPALLRNVLRIVDVLPAFYIVGVILIARSPEKRRLGDRVAGTYVVSAKSLAARASATP